MDKRMFSASVAFSMVSVLTLTMPGSALATTASQLCTGNPCVITAALTIEAGSNLDFGSAAVRLTPNARLTVGAGAPPRSVSIRSASLVFEPGARLLGGGDDADVTIVTTVGNFELQSSGASKSKIDLNSPFAGVLSITAEGDALLDGVIDIGASGPDGFAGLLDVTAGGRIALTQQLFLDATGLFAQAGEVLFYADGDINIGADISGLGQGGAGTITLDSQNGNILLAGQIDVSGVGADASAESVDLIAHNGRVAIASTGGIKGTGGSGAMEACGDGGFVLIDAALGVTQAGKFDLGGGFQCGGGEVSVLTGDSFSMLPGSLSDLSGTGAYGYGGFLTVEASGDASLGPVKLSSPGGGGVLVVTVGHKASFVGFADVRGTSAESFGGIVEVTACEIEITATADVDSSGKWVIPGAGKNLLRAGGAITIAGKLTGSDKNELRYKSAPPVITGTVDPAPTLIVDTSLADCAGGCGNGALDSDETCDDGNLTACDGCSSNCQILEGVCGDGVRDCGEQCDDANLTDADGCDADCTPTGLADIRFRSERAATGCLAQWGVQLGNARINPRSGGPFKRQECVDGDPECDVDGRINRSCTFRSRVCLRAPDDLATGCSTASVDYVKIRSPRVDAGNEPTDLANADRIADALQSLGGNVHSGDQTLQTGPSIEAPDSCTPQFELEVPIRLGHTGRRTFNIAARGTDGTLMRKNPLRLSCEQNMAVCGDGVRSVGEACDDGNRAGCDGCAANCRVESCGDGVSECSEQCDAGTDNGTAASRCADSCELLPPPLRIPGGGSRASDCSHQWAPEAAEYSLKRERGGVLAGQVRCTDGDSNCDFGDAPDSCLFHLWSCAGLDDAATGCTANPLVAVALTAPRSGTARPWEALARNEILSAIAEFGLTTPAGESCTAMTELALPAGRTLRFRLVADTQVNTRLQHDSDKLILRCDFN